MLGPILPAVSLETAAAAVGTELFSPWRVVSQEIIDSFADATDDHQPIHCNPEFASQTPYGGTIAHGFLLLSLLSALAYETAPPLEGATMGVNQGFDRVRFVSPVRSGSRVRAKFVLQKLKARPSGFIEIVHDVTLELEGSEKPALVANWLTLSFVPPQDAG